MARSDEVLHKRLEEVEVECEDGQRCAGRNLGLKRSVMSRMDFVVKFLLGQLGCWRRG